MVYTRIRDSRPMRKMFEGGGVLRYHAGPLAGVGAED
jgi:hypothetical protein